MEIYGAKINGLNDSVGFEYDPLLCFWKIRESRGRKQMNSKIQVATDADLAAIVYEKEGDLNCVGEVLDFALQPYTRYFYQITVESDVGEVARSEIHFFETAKLNDPWQAKWIGVAGDDTHPEFQKAFAVKGEVCSARLYICGLGIFEAYINGQKAGNDLLAPFINDYEEHFQYCTYDVTDLLRAENKISVLLGDGWYRGHFGLGSPTHYERPLALIAELRIKYTDGYIENINTDESWIYRRSFTTLSDIYNGEIQNYSQPLGAWKQAIVIDAPGKLCQRYSSPLHYMETLPVKPFRFSAAYSATNRFVVASSVQVAPEQILLVEANPNPQDQHSVLICAFCKMLQKQSGVLNIIRIQKFPHIYKACGNFC